jgi:hypothetical protein
MSLAVPDIDTGISLFLSGAVVPDVYAGISLFLSLVAVPDVDVGICCNYSATLVVSS